MIINQESIKFIRGSNVFGNISIKTLCLYDMKFLTLSLLFAILSQKSVVSGIAELGFK